MAKEIERKFNINGNFPYWDYKKSIYYSEKNITQGYFGDGVTRVRIINQGIYEENERAYLTIKSERKSISRSEFEYEIPIDDALQMLEEFCENKIEKTRYRFKELDKRWEVDIFRGENESLVLAEIELRSEDEEFEFPDFIGEEVTGNEGYYNSYLAKHPYINWENKNEQIRN